MGGKMKKNIKFTKGILFIYAFSLLSIGTLFSSCEKASDPVLPADAFELEISDYVGDSENVFNDVQHWRQTNKRIMVVFGYDFNFYPVMDNLKDYLESKFGLADENGLVLPLIFPEDFRHNGKFFSSDFYALLNDNANDLAGVIILGAPENTHLALARYQDIWGNNVPFPLIALFPQDDVLGLESTCDFIIEKKSNDGVKRDNDLTEEDSAFFEDAPYVLANVIKYILANDGGFNRDSNLLTHVNQALKQMTVHHYIDPETGIPAINHFVLD